MNTITIDIPTDTTPEELDVTTPQVDTIEAEPVTEEPAVDTAAPEEVADEAEPVEIEEPEEPVTEEPTTPETEEPVTEEPTGPEVTCEIDETGAEFCWWDVNDGTIEICWIDVEGSLCLTTDGNICGLDPETGECIFVSWDGADEELDPEADCDLDDLECVPPAPVEAQTVAQVSQGTPPAQLAETGADALLAPVLGFALIVAATAAIVGAKIRKVVK